MSPTAATPGHQNRAVWYAVLGVVVLAGLIAVLAARGTNEDANEEVQAQQTSDVEVGKTTSATSTEPDTTDTAPKETDQAEPEVEVPQPSATALPVFQPGGADPAVGQEIPTVSGETLEGEPITIGADGKAKVVLFVAHWCPHCQREIPTISEHLRDNPLPDDVELLTVSTGVAEERGNYPPSAWLKNAGWTAPVLADSEDSATAQAYGLSAFPYFVVADADGKVVTRASGELDGAAFDALVTAAQSGQV